MLLIMPIAKSMVSTLILSIISTAAMISFIERAIFIFLLTPVPVLLMVSCSVQTGMDGIRLMDGRMTIPISSDGMSVMNFGEIMTVLYIPMTWMPAPYL